MSKQIHVTLTDKGYESLMRIINEYFHGCKKSTAVECSIIELERKLDSVCKQK